MAFTEAADDTFATTQRAMAGNRPMRKEKMKKAPPMKVLKSAIEKVKPKVPAFAKG